MKSQHSGRHALQHAQQLFAAYPKPFWVAGGWAIDLFTGTTHRAHSDLDILVLARDLPDLAATFTHHQLIVEDAATGQHHDWDPDQPLQPGPHTLIFPDSTGAGCPVQILLAATDGDHWVYHRGSGRIRRPLTDIILTTTDGLRVLAPEIVLLFKSRSLRDKDHHDFNAAVDHLGPHRARWLHDHIKPWRPDHPWLPALQQATHPQP
jgi:hypothetical protein